MFVVYQLVQRNSEYGPGSDANERLLRIPQSSSLTGTSPSDCLVSYTGHSLVGEQQSVYSTAPADWARELSVTNKKFWF